ncbi:hypothetical protein BX600DRAFT_452247 [Xylariales sp. PMI_506]|nr:hypothetical protein BX600DRAFT_452247 [Xylariales sp. PMI_506]
MFAEFYCGLRLPWIRNGLSAGEFPLNDDPRWASISKFFSRSWFSRLWIVQEFVLAKNPILICGKRHINWENLYAGTCTYRNGGIQYTTAGVQRGQLGFMCMASVRRIRQLRTSKEGEVCLAYFATRSHILNKFEYCRLIHLLHYFRISDTSITRDRYFALASIADDVASNEGTELELSYEKPTHHTITQVGKFIIRNSYGEEMLARAGLWQRHNPRIPSWIQDFSPPLGISEMLDRTMAQRDYDAAGGTKFLATTMFHAKSANTEASGEFIMVQAIRLDIIDAEPFTSPLQGQTLFHEYGLGKEYVSKAIRALLGNESETRYFNGEHISDAVLATLISGTLRAPGDLQDLYRGFLVLSWTVVARNQPRATAWISYRASRRYGLDANALHALFVKYADKVSRSAIYTQTQPARTRQGYFASLPPCFRPGDEIWVVKGCQTPLLLRKSEHFRGCHQLVGNCYLHGFMNGEGPKKKGFQYERVTLH